MKVAVWDTYVSKKDGSKMHFDIVVSAEIKEETIYQHGKSYLIAKKQEGQPLAAKECSFCHVGQATPQMIEAINRQGYFIIEISGCE